MGKCYMDQIVNVKNLSTGILIFPDSKVKSYNLQPLWSKRSTVLYPEMVFHHPGGEQGEEGGTKEFFEMQPLPFNLCAKYCHITPLL